MDYSEICYKKSCLSQVIFRLDFLEFINSDLLFSSAVEKVLLPSFPKKGMQQIIRFQTMNVTVDNEGTKAKQTTREGLQQEFLNSDGNKMVLANKFIVLELNKYTRYEKELDRFVPVLRTLMAETQLTAMRTGIRYINEFGAANGIRAQKNYFTSPASALADVRLPVGERGSLIRAMALSEYVIDDMRLNFRYGQYNPQYPQPVKQASFVLDYDCYCEEPIMGLESILEHINKGHDAIQDLFERSITEKLKKVMRDE